MTILIPKKNTAVYNLYAYTYVTNKYFIKGKGNILFSKGVAVMLYKYKNYRKALVVHEYPKGSYIPGIKERVMILKTVEGRSFDNLKNATFNLQKIFGDNIFLCDASSWLKATALLSHFNGKQSAATKSNLINLFKKCEQDKIRRKIV